MDSYQAVYDAVRSKIGAFDGQALVQEIAQKFDISYSIDRMVKNDSR